MSTAMNRIDKIKAGFIHHQLTPIIELPTYDTISLLQRETNTNNATFYSGSGNGTLGMLRVSISETKYSILSGGVSFGIPVHPGDFTKTTGIGTTVGQIADARGTHAEKLEESHTWEYTNKASIALIVQSVDKILPRRPEHRTYGFTTKTCL